MIMSRFDNVMMNLKMEQFVPIAIGIENEIVERIQK